MEPLYDTSTGQYYYTEPQGLFEGEELVPFKMSWFYHDSYSSYFTLQNFIETLLVMAMPLIIFVQTIAEGVPDEESDRFSTVTWAINRQLTMFLYAVNEYAFWNQGAMSMARDSLFFIFYWGQTLNDEVNLALYYAHYFDWDALLSQDELQFANMRSLTSDINKEQRIYAHYLLSSEWRWNNLYVPQAQEQWQDPIFKAYSPSEIFQTRVMDFFKFIFGALMFTISVIPLIPSVFVFTILDLIVTESEVPLNLTYYEQASEVLAHYLRPRNYPLMLMYNLIGDQITQDRSYELDEILELGYYDPCYVLQSPQFQEQECESVRQAFEDAQQQEAEQEAQEQEEQDIIDEEYERIQDVTFGVLAFVLQVFWVIFQAYWTLFSILLEIFFAVL